MIVDSSLLSSLTQDIVGCEVRKYELSNDDDRNLKHRE